MTACANMLLDYAEKLKQVINRESVFKFSQEEFNKELPILYCYINSKLLNKKY